MSNVADEMILGRERTGVKDVRGICPIVAVPFMADGRLDADSFQSLVRHLLRTGSAALTLFGLASEFYKLTDAERETLTQIFLAETSAHPSIAGVISITDHSADVAVEKARAAEAAGADALMVLPPFFLSPGEGAIVMHIARVAAAVRVPIVVQYAPAQTGIHLSPGEFARLAADHPNIRYVKVETQPPGRYVSMITERSAGELAALVGYAGLQMPDALARGAVGIQPGCSFVEIYVDALLLYQAGGLREMLPLHMRLLPYIGYWMQGVELIIQAEKIILQRRGIIATDYCRAPGYAMDAPERAMIEHFLDEFAPWLGACG